MGGRGIKHGGRKIEHALGVDRMAVGGGVEMGRGLRLDRERGGGDPGSGWGLGVGDLGRAGVELLGLSIGEGKHRRWGREFDGREEVVVGGREVGSRRRAGDGQTLLREGGHNS